MCVCVYAGAPSWGAAEVFMILQKNPPRLSADVDMPFITLQESAPMTVDQCERNYTLSPGLVLPTGLGREGALAACENATGFDKHSVLEKAGTPDTGCFLHSLLLLVGQPSIL